MSYEFGDVVLVPFPFTNHAASKKRPAVVVSSAAYNRAKSDVVVMVITSQLRASPTLGEVWIRQWQTAELISRQPSNPCLRRSNRRSSSGGSGHCPASIRRS